MGLLPITAGLLKGSGNMSSRVKELAEHTMSNSQFVTVLPERVKVVAEQMQGFEFVLPTWDFPPFYPQTDSLEDMCLYYLLLNSINYCYFDEYDNRFQDGDYRSSTLAGLRITENFAELNDLEFLCNVEENYLLCELFKADNPISLVKERAAAFREIGEFLRVNTEFTFERWFAKCYNNAYFVSQSLPNLFHSWADPFFKRSQLFVGMVQGRFDYFEKGVEDLTVFADYRVPQTLHSMGMIRYEPSLLKTISSNTLIPYGTKQELEIRAATIVATGMLTDELNAYHNNSLNALHIDYLLWSAMRKRGSLPSGVMSAVDIPHHRTMTTDY
jgi:hypothetical protein